MRVLTVDNEEFKRLCLRLKAEVKASGYNYDAVVAIARAGIYVAEAMEAGNFFIVKCHREGTSAKNKAIGKILRYLPAVINIGLRKLEFYLLKLRDSSVSFAPREVEIPQELRDYLNGGNQKILIVDDAADSGRSLKSVMIKLGEIGSDNHFRSAVITSTRPKTIMNPDYSLFRNQTLIRFPWAVDVKKK